MPIRNNNMLDPNGYSGTYDLDAGNLALDFTNTLSNRLRQDPHDWLHSYANLVAWGELIGILSNKVSGLLLKGAAEAPDQANRALASALDLRETTYRVFSATVAGRPPRPVDIETLNAFLSQALVHSRIVPEDGAFVWDWNAGEKALDRIIWPVIRSAADLLASDQLGRVGECQGDGCGWLFLDMSRNRSRRWCSMEECGNREKARRHYARIRKE